MKKISYHDKRGFAHMVLILGLVVVLVVGGAGYYVYSKNKNNKNSTTTTSTTSTTAASSEVVDATCSKLYSDKNLCKFASKYNPNAPVKIAFADTDPSGKVTAMEMSSDGKNNYSMVSKESGKETSAFISLNGDTYIKDETTGGWTKYPKSPDTSQSTNPTSDLSIDFKGEEAKTPDQRITYKNLGKEACGNLTCYKYQEIDPAQPGTTSYFWFGTKDYQLHQWAFTDKDGNKSVGTFTYAAVTISVPSPVTAAPATPSQADVQNYLNQVQSQGASQ